MSFVTKKINKENIKVIPLPKIDPKKILGYEIIPKLYANIFICAKKGSGKTNIIYKILEECINKETKVIIFAATHDIDDNWKYIKKQLEKKNINTIFYSSIQEDKTSNIEEILDFMKSELTSENEEIEDKKNVNELIQVIKFDEVKGSKVKISKPKIKSPKFMIIFDDMTSELKNKDVAKLLKTFRHYKSKVIVSTQWPNDLKPEARKQFDYFLLFDGHSEKKLEELYSDIGLNISFEEFYKAYQFATKEKYDFLYVNQHTSELRKNFTDEIILPNNINEKK